jgi:U5 snRNP spliceosome subunit
MKRCPQCNRNYEDDALSFCLDDGSPLVSASAPSSFDPSATVQYPQPRDTSPPPTVAFQPGQPPPPIPPPAWSPMPPPQTRKRSVWPWLIGIGAVVVFMGIGVVILIFAVASVTNTNNNNNNRAGLNTNNNNNRAPNRNSNENTNTRSDLTNFTDDFSIQSWGTRPSQYGKSWYQDESYHMSATKGYYIVMYAPDKPEYKTENATVRVGLRSIDGDPPVTGYGLVVHGAMNEDKLEDYAFLIYNGSDPKYKIVEHKDGKEGKLVDWTSSSAIRTGTSPNQIEVRIRDLKMDLYINGQFVTTITDVNSYRHGRAGLYTSDAGEVAFDDLEVSK